MRSLWFVSQGQLEWRDLPAPRLAGDLEALVAPIASSTCDIDRFVVSRPSPFRDPYPIGHNAVGRVLEVGDAVTSVRPGDLVAVAWHISCGQCDRCRRGLEAHCRESAPGTSYGMPTGDRWGGLFDEVVRVPFADAMLHPLPAGVDPVEYVATSDNLTQGHAAVAPHLKAGRRRVLVLGWGINGLYATAFARSLGAEAVTYVDGDPENCALAADLGAEVAEALDRGLGPFDLIVDASADPRPLHRHGLHVLEPEGMVECIGHMGDVAVPGWTWYGKGASLHCGVCSTGPQVRGCFEQLGGGGMIPSRLWSERVAWDDDLPAAFANHRRQLVAVRDDV